ncbi:MAG: signal recognition particle-docking protein FtsY [Deltaproteobacteria bacterium]|nr:signal recognition particle-docking protein FtsY [Deltaproteobacteria bacterium]
MQNTQTGTTPAAPVPPPDGGDIAGLIFFALFFAAFFALGIAFVRKRNRQNREELAAELDKAPPPDEQAPQLTEGEPPLQAGEATAAHAPAPVVPKDDTEARDAYRRGLEKTRTGFFSRLTTLLSGTREIDEKIVDELEPLLIQADVGVKTTQKLMDLVRQRLSSKELSSAEKVRDAIRDEILRMVSVPAPVMEERTERPCVVMVVGVNGAGKTTTIGKLAHRLRQRGHTVVLGAGDTFRAAAVEQLRVWGDRAGCVTVEGKEGQDSAAVLFDSVKKGKEEGAAFILGDTAGRLHTKVNLMEELKKVRRVMAKAHEGAPHEVLLVLDATTGQNALIQAEQFNQALELSGVILTKVDGTAKGGVIIAICDQLKLPVRFVGVGEKLSDLRPFDPAAFVDGLFAEG